MVMLGKESLHKKKTFSKRKNHSTAFKDKVLEWESLRNPQKYRQCVKYQTKSFLQWIG